MKQTFNLIIAVLLFSVFSCFAFAQIDGAKKHSVQTSLKNSQCGKDPQVIRSNGRITVCRSPIRYVIVYNEIFNEKERRMQLLLHEDNYNKEDLTVVVELIKKRFTSPFSMSVEIHTNLKTIETPEERELEHWSGDIDDPIDEQYDKHKTARFYRYFSGHEVLSFRNAQGVEEDVVINNVPFDVLCR